MPVFQAPDGARLHYSDEGAGKPVLALSGLTRNSTDFDYVARHLDGIRLIRMDYRGRGNSEWTGADTYTIPTESLDALTLLDHLELQKTAILGTSRGGLIAMGLAATARNRLTGVALVDIGPDVAPAGLEAIKSFVGRNPGAKTYAQATAMRAKLLEGFVGVPESRWFEEVRKHYVETPEGLKINYDPALRDATLKMADAPPVDLWPFFDAMQGLPLALVRGANSDLLAPETAAEMRRRRPDMIFADVPDRGHVPFLDEPESLAALHQWIESLP